MKSKKKFLLLGVGAMGALALGVGATSTFAWYAANASVATTGVNGVQSGILTAEDTSATASSFLVTITMTDPGDSVHLTDGSGVTRLYNSTTGQNPAMGSQPGTKYTLSTVTVGIQYSGDNVNADNANAEWDAEVGTTDLVLKVCDTSDYASHIEDAVETNNLYKVKTKAAANYTADSSAYGQNQYGLKFGTQAGDSPEASELNALYANTQVKGAYDASTNASAGFSVTIDDEVLTGLSFNGAGYASTTVKLLIGVWGVDGVAQLTTDSYSVKIIPTASWIDSVNDPA